LFYRIFVCISVNTIREKKIREKNIEEYNAQ